VWVAPLALRNSSPGPAPGILSEDSIAPPDLPMHATLTVVAGPHVGKEFRFEGHDTFLVGRTRECHFQLNYDDKYFSRRHFLIEVNPPRCRVIDLNSRNGIKVNGAKVQVAELKNGDEVQAGKTVFKLALPLPPGLVVTVAQPAAPPEPASEDLPTALPDIPGFALEKEVGRGGMGIVYRAKRETDGKRVAIKTILPDAAADQRDIDRFLREAQILEQLDHPNVVKYLGSGMLGPMLYLVMEYVNGPTAHMIVKDRGPMSVTAGVKLILQAIQGLAHAHGLGFVHRDIKPSNLLVGKVGEKRIVKVADFGLARAFNDSRLSGLTMMGDVSGTPAFMAPEQITHYRDTQPAADQYAAAATLYFLLTGRFVYDFGTGDPARAFAVILSEDPVPIRERRPDLAEGVAGVIDRALGRDASGRFADVREFGAALAGVIGR
jgi:hypothetical protein